MDNYKLFFPSSSSSSSASLPKFPFTHGRGGGFPSQFNPYNGSSFNGGFLGLMSEEGYPLAAKEDNHHLNAQVGDSVAGESDEKVGKKKGEEKKARQERFAFQTRSKVDILDDGYRWRKYGQKAVKNNKFPRSYYKCTYQGCNVKKQVQRLTGDEGVVVTTYEGVHTHLIDKPNENFEHILSQMHIYHPC